MRIAVDLDGVLADLHTPFMRTAARLFPDIDPVAIAVTEGSSAPPGGAPDQANTGDGGPAKASSGLSRRQTEAIWREISATVDFWEGLEEIEAGAVASLAAVAGERRWEVLFVTSRPETRGATVQRQSQRWLERHGFALPSLTVVHGSRGRVAQALSIDVVVDDRVDNCLDVVLESKAGALLVWRGGQAAVPASTNRLGIAVVPTVSAALEALVQAERDASGGGGVVERLLRLFGLKPRAASQILR